MKQQVTTAIILQRTDYGEADRILTVMTPDMGKLRLLAKGVRRVKSKLAGGIELFSVSQITFIKGRGEIGTLVSARLEHHYRHIIESIDRTMTGYEMIKRCNKLTEDQTDPAYFDLLRQVFVALDEPQVPLALIWLWFEAQLLGLGGHMPNLYTDTTGQKLRPDKNYAFDSENMTFVLADAGRYGARHIKFLRLVFARHSPQALRNVEGYGGLVEELRQLLQVASQHR